MVNFNFGLGGSTNDNKKDDSAVQDNSKAQDPVTQGDASVSGEDILSPEKAAEPIFDETVRETEVNEKNISAGAFSPFDESTDNEKKDSEENIEINSVEVPAPEAEDPFSVEKTTETTDVVEVNPLADVNNLEKDTSEDLNSSDSVLPNATLVADVNMPEFETPPVAENPIKEEEKPSETVKENPFPSASVPVVPVVAPENVPKQEPVAENLAQPSMGILPTMGVPQKTEELKKEKPEESAEVVNPLPAMDKTPEAPAVENNKEKPAEEAAAPSLVGGKLPSVNKPEEDSTPDIPTFGQPEKSPDNLIGANKPAVFDPLVPAPAPVDNSTDVFGSSSNDESKKEVPVFDPLAPAPEARIGDAPEEKKKTVSSIGDMFGESKKDVLETSVEESSDLNLTEESFSDLGGGSFGDDDSLDDSNLAKNSSADPLATLQKLKDDISDFVEKHNAKIDGYNNKIEELNKQIAEEKKILKEKQKKSKKILEDLTSLVTDFFHKESKKESHKKDKKDKKEKNSKK